MSKSIAYFLDSDHALLFLGQKAAFRAEKENDLDDLQRFLDEHPHSYKVVALSYDLKNKIDRLHSDNVDLIDFPSFIVWEPEMVWRKNAGNWQCLSAENEKIAESIRNSLEDQLFDAHDGELPNIAFQAGETKEEYLNSIAAVQREIQYGNTYEVNYCQTFFAKNIPDFNAETLVQKLFQLTQAPFSAYVKFDEFELFCASPERFLKKEGEKLISQPIKGTIARGKTSEEDEKLKQTLVQSTKDQAENVMIVDLVRNDLSKIAKKGTVKVEELAGIHSFNTVHHLISTIACQVRKTITFTDILRATFPMGSMTGAPKISTMEISEREEKFQRGWYSGSVGYIAPNNDFDLNVVIRSFVKNNLRKTISCSVGGAITTRSVAEEEYRECQTKVKKILELFGRQDAI